MGKKRQSNWQNLVSQVQIDDGLPTREAGPWTFDKLWWWNRYIEITTVAMVGSRPIGRTSFMLICLRVRESVRADAIIIVSPDHH